METIHSYDFFGNFMEISKNLTLSEVQMLYLLIKDPSVRSLSQQEFADKIGTHRRTINIGLKKLVQFGYLSYEEGLINSNSKVDMYITEDGDSHNLNYKLGCSYDKFTYEEFNKSNKGIKPKNFDETKKIVIQSFVEVYNKRARRGILLNKDFDWFGKTIPILPKNPSYRYSILHFAIKYNMPENIFFGLNDINLSEKQITFISSLNKYINEECIGKETDFELDYFIKKFIPDFESEDKLLQALNDFFPFLEIEGDKIRPINYLKLQK